MLINKVIYIIVLKLQLQLQLQLQRIKLLDLINKLQI